MLVNGVKTEWFSIETGVRQGCVLSPLLYARFINGLVDEIIEAKLGVEVGPGCVVGCLLYADDIVQWRMARRNCKQCWTLLRRMPRSGDLS